MNTIADDWMKVIWSDETKIHRRMVVWTSYGRMDVGMFSKNDYIPILEDSYLPSFDILIFGLEGGQGDIFCRTMTRIV